MENKGIYIKSLGVIISVLLMMSVAGYCISNGEKETAQKGIVEAASFMPLERQQEEKESGISFAVKETVNIKDEAAPDQKAPALNTRELTPADNPNKIPIAEEKEVQVVAQTFAASVDQKAFSKPIATVTETPVIRLEVTESPAAKVEESQLTAALVSYSWGSSANYVFRMEVKVSNCGSETARNVNVLVPLLENSSPYQKTNLRSVNFEIIGSSGRISTFNLGDIAPGEAKTIVADFDISVRSLSINSSNETLDRARRIYEQYAGSGNCRDLALVFINKCREQGITAREVIGFARSQRGPMTSGSLQGCRHSWAEINVEGLGWVPVDLTFQYFGAFPHTSHIVESYGDQSIKITYTGGSLSASWSNAVM